MYDTQYVIAVCYRIHDDTHRKDIVNLIHRLALHEGLFIDTVNTLDTAGNIDVMDFPFQTVIQALLDFRHKMHSVLALFLQLPFNFGIAHGVKVPDR